LQLARTLLVLDSRLGPIEISAIHHSAAAAWTWSFDPRLLDGVFLDPTGGSHDVAGLAAGDVVPGTDWIYLDAARVKTRGGLVYAFDAVGRLAARHWASDPYPRITHRHESVGAFVRPVAIEQCDAGGACEPLFTLGWDGQGRLVSVDDRAGRRAEIGWDAAGRLVATRDAGDVADGWPGDRYGYQDGDLVSLTRSDGEQVAYVHQAGRVVAATAVGAGSPTTTFLYERIGPDRNRTTVEDPVGARVELVWDDARRVLERSQLDLGETETWAWSGLRAVRHEAVDGRVTERSYQDGWLASETRPDGNQLVYAWNPDGVNRLAPFAGAIAAVDDAVGSVLAVGYDPDGRPSSLVNGAGESTLLRWSGLALSEVEDAAGAIVAYADYGEHGQPETVSPAGGVAESHVFDAVGNRLVGHDTADPTASSTPGVVERGFDADRRVKSLILATRSPVNGVQSEETLSIVRRADGRPLRIARPYGGDTEFVYDGLGRLVERRERVDGVWQPTRFEYDAAGRRIAEEKPNGMRREWAFDAAGRLTRETSLRDGVVEGFVAHTWSEGLRVESFDSIRGASELQLHDAAGRPVETVHPGGERTARSFDARGRIASVVFTLPGGTELGRILLGYDGADREISVATAGETLLQRGFAAGRHETTAYGNGLSRSYAYPAGSPIWSGATTTDGSGAFVAETTRSVTTTELAAITSVGLRTADPNGWVVDPPAGSAPGEVETLELYWLTAGIDPERPHGMRLWNATHEALEFGGTFHDALGNPVQAAHYPAEGDLDLHRFHYNAERNRLLSVTKDVWVDGSWEDQTIRSYAYDEAGYVTDVDGNAVAWSARGQIAQVGGLASFAWDASGRPISRTVAGEQTFAWFGGLLEAPAGSTPSELDLGEVRVDFAGAAHRYRHFGPRGNVKFVTDAAGQVTAHHLYGGYGRIATYGPSDDARGFAGGTHAAGFVVLGARVLDPLAGRFLSRDPVEQLLDAYAYAWSNPVQFWDPGGLHPTGTPNAPAIALAAEIVGNFLLAAGGFLSATPTVPTRVAGGVAFFLGAAAHSLASGLRRPTPADGGEASFNAFPPTPAAGMKTVRFCVDGFCFEKPATSGGFAGGGSGLGGGGDVGLAASGCPTPSGAMCAGSPGMWVAIALGIAWRRRRLKLR
ncbi:MAG: hypothetical protein HKP30_12950, partial [Myxococcales bacterium]|nr:hypothetical protein [Myxococcales bacterium]